VWSQLKKTAVPSQFPNLPHFFHTTLQSQDRDSRASTRVRTTTAGTYSRREIISRNQSETWIQHQIPRDIYIMTRKMKRHESEDKEPINWDFFCALETSKSLQVLSKYLLEQKKLDCVLLGKINSDITERRLGRNRQLAGTNYFISVWQFLEAKKAIRLKSLVRVPDMTLREIQRIIFPE